MTSLGAHDKEGQDRLRTAQGVGALGNLYVLPPPPGPCHYDAVPLSRAARALRSVPTLDDEPQPRRVHGACDGCGLTRLLRPRATHGDAVMLCSGCRDV